MNEKLISKAHATAAKVERLATSIDAELRAVDDRCRGLSDDDARRVMAESGAVELVGLAAGMQETLRAVTASV
jgi:predicted trehalose synthase